MRKRELRNMIEKGESETVEFKENFDKVRFKVLSATGEKKGRKYQLTAISAKEVRK